MADDKEKTAIKSCELRKCISQTRKNVRAFNNRTKDAEINNDSTDVPCKKCVKQIQREGKELIKETCRLKKFFENHRNSNFINCCCPHLSSDGDESKDICDDFHLKYLSSTRKIMRDYNDNLQDGVYEDKDRGPCETCKRCITNECDGLIQELEKLNGLQLVSTGACRYGFMCVPMRQGVGRRSDHHTIDSGFGSVNSEILKESPVTKEGTESHDATANDTEDGTKEEPVHSKPTAESEGRIIMECSIDKGYEKGPSITLEVGSSSDQDSSNA
ncbi:uncharacterized protein LOC125652242 [Ostrea edulis]|uniref:uncharacterized protein LOC125652242 n=1 Tax=Ostrea edulis TaxID=37623 RepID=UPI0024AED44B|nr:uncharacterized protein LOC125652242 [Ostrea edulis]